MIEGLYYEHVHLIDIIPKCDGQIQTYTLMFCSAST